MFYQAFQQDTRLSRSLLDNVGQLYANTLFIGNLFEFLALQPKVLNAAGPQPVLPVREAIRFRNISFRYPGTDRLALKWVGPRHSRGAHHGRGRFEWRG